MDTVTQEQFESLKEEVEQQNDQLQEQQKMLSEHTGALRDLHEVSALVAEAIEQIAVIANVGFAMSNNASGIARNRLIAIGTQLEHRQINKAAGA